MPIPRDASRESVQAFLEEEHPDCASGVDLIGKLSRQLGELLEQTDATDESAGWWSGWCWGLSSPLTIFPPARNRNCCTCEDGFGVEITH
jgi:hypothetical protein